MAKSSNLTAPLTPTSLERKVATRSLAGWLAFGFGSGLARYAPGTAGSLAALIPWLAIAQLNLLGRLLIIAAAFVVGVWICQRVSDRLGVEDHRGIVWDEFVGQWLTLALLPLSWTALGLGFLLFRLFDVWKPWPVNLADRKLKGGFGIMVDDLLAAIWAGSILWLLHRFSPVDWI